MKESPEYLKISTASAMALDLKPGRFYRGAVNPCINLLLTYEKGCYANCAYCGLAARRPGAYENKSFIHVAWPTVDLNTLVERMKERENRLKRVCISMVTNPRAVEDTLVVAGAVRNGVNLPLSLLISPTLVKDGHMERFKQTGADMVGVALDAATEDLFAKHRGSGVKGPHRWGHYEKVLKEALEIFGRGNVSVHLVVGLGESEQEMVETFQRVHDRGALIHLFSFFAEAGSVLQDRPQPPWASYLRLQLARWLIENDRVRLESFSFDEGGRITGFGVDGEQLDSVVNSGLPFLTSGCPGEDGSVACNRPFGNCLPDVRQWNYPYLPNQEELAQIREGLGL